MNKPATVIVIVFLFVVSLMHLARALLDVEVIIAGATMPMWPSKIACVVTALLAGLLWREARKG